MIKTMKKWRVRFHFNELSNTKYRDYFVDAENKKQALAIIYDATKQAPWRYSIVRHTVSLVIVELPNVWPAAQT
jgi:hypothetical protein